MPTEIEVFSGGANPPSVGISATTCPMGTRMRGNTISVHMTITLVTVKDPTVVRIPWPEIAQRKAEGTVQESFGMSPIIMSVTTSPFSLISQVSILGHEGS